MSGSGNPSNDPDILASAKALRRAAKRALDLGLQTGTPVYVMKRGKIVDIAHQQQVFGEGLARFSPDDFRDDLRRGDDGQRILFDQVLARLRARQGAEGQAAERAIRREEDDLRALDMGCDRFPELLSQQFSRGGRLRRSAVALAPRIDRVAHG